MRGQKIQMFICVSLLMGALAPRQSYAQISLTEARDSLFDGLDAGEFLITSDQNGNVAAFAYETEIVDSASPGFFRGLAKGAFVGVATVGGGLVGWELGGPVGAGIGGGAAAAGSKAFVTECNREGSSIVHDIVFLEFAVIEGTDIVPELVSRALASIQETRDIWIGRVPGESHRIHFVNPAFSQFAGRVVSETGTIKTVGLIHPILIEATTSMGTQHVLGIVISNDPSIVGLDPIDPTDVLDMEFGDLTDVPEGTTVQAATATCVVCSGFTPSPVPTVSEWGLFILMLFLLTLGTLTLGRRRFATANPSIEEE